MEVYGVIHLLEIVILKTMLATKLIYETRGCIDKKESGYQIHLPHKCFVTGMGAELTTRGILK